MAALVAALGSGSGGCGSRGGGGARSSNNSSGRSGSLHGSGGAGRSLSGNGSSRGGSRGGGRSGRGSRSRGGSGRSGSRARATKGGGDGGAGHGVGVEGGVQVEEDTGVGLGVQGGAQGAGGQLGAGAGDLEVHAHGVVLGTVRVLGAVERDDLVAQDVVAGLERGGDGDVVGEVVGDQVVGRPDSRVGAGDETRCVNLDPLEGGLVNGGWVVSGRNVGDHWAVVLRMC